MAEFVKILIILGGSLGKIGLDLIIMSSNELDGVYDVIPTQSGN